MKTDEEREKEVSKLFKYGYVDTILSARCGVPMSRVNELRVFGLLREVK